MTHSKFRSDCQQSDIGKQLWNWWQEGKIPYMWAVILLQIQQKEKIPTQTVS